MFTLAWNDKNLEKPTSNSHKSTSSSTNYSQIKFGCQSFTLILYATYPITDYKYLKEVDLVLLYYAELQYLKEQLRIRKALK